MPKSILIVEDNPLSLKLFSDVLVTQGYVVWLATSVREGLRLLRRNVPDLCLIDVVLPDSSGPEMVRIMKVDPQLRSVPVLLTSAFRNQADVAGWGTAECDGYVAKPVAVADLMRQVRAALAGAMTADVADAAMPAMQAQGG
jgi:two-component system, cell cycle response regulator DivK